MNIIDTHMHINSKLNNIEEITNINNNPDIECVINVGVNAGTSSETVEIANSNTKFYSAVGVHPLNTSCGRVNKIFELATSNKVVAVGEIGLDCSKNGYASNLIYEEQVKCLVNQIIIANELKLPVIIHSNNTNKLILEIFKKIKPEYGCVFHCFQPDLDDLKKILDYGYYISFAGNIDDSTLEVAKIVPKDRFLIETDSPYISPVPYKDSTGKSEYIKYIVEKLAEIKETTPEEIANLANMNTKKLFKIKNML